MTTEQIQQIEQQIGELTVQLSELRKASPAIAVPNYTFETNAGKTTLLELFGPHDKLFAIHNMGQGCRYCTLWADGFNGLLSHLESAMSVALLSKDPPELQRRFANSRGWRFSLASHANSNYLSEQTVYPDAANYPGLSFTRRKMTKYSGRTRVCLDLATFIAPCGTCWVWQDSVKRIGFRNSTTGNDLINLMMVAKEFSIKVIYSPVASRITRKELPGSSSCLEVVFSESLSCDIP